MLTKVCTNCGRELPATTEYFYIRKDNKDGLRNDCKACHNERSRQYRENNKDKLLDYNRKYYIENNKQILQKKKEYYEQNKDSILKNTHEYRKNNKGLVVEARKRCYQNNKEVVKRKRVEYYQKNKAVVLEKDKVYKKKYRERYRTYHRKRKKEKYATDLWFNLNEKMASGIRISLRVGKRGRHWETLVGFTLDDLIVHLESQFQPGMNWDVFMTGAIHIDHIRPKSSFDFTSPDDPEFKQCWALENLQPLWAVDNLKKGAAWI